VCAEDLSLGFAGVITDLGEETSPDTLAEARTETCLVDLITDMMAATIEVNREPTHGLGGKTGTGAAETCRAMLNTTADTRTLLAAAKTGLKMGIMRQDLGHEAPPSAGKRGACLLFILSYLLVGTA